MEKQRVRISGRYFRNQIQSLFLRIHNAGKKTMRYTESERAVKLLSNSLQNDFREGFRKKEHGYDAYQVAEEKRSVFEEQIESEQRAQESEYLSEVIEVLRETLSIAELRKAEIDAGRGSVVFLERQRQLAESRNKIRKAV